MTDHGHVALLGAGGTMGLPMARNLARAGLRVRAWNRSPEKIEQLAGEGIELAGSPSAAADGADVVLTMLSDADAVLGSIAGSLDSLSAHAVWLQMSTVGEQGTERCCELARERDITFIDAPVLGTKQPAEQGTLVVLASGPEELRDRVQPIFDAVGQRTIWVGPAGAGTRLKLVANAWVLAVVEGAAEAIALAEGLELDPQLLLDALEGGVLDLPYLRIKADVIAKRSFEPAFRLSLAAKDADLIDDSARRRELDLPLFATISKRMGEAAVRHGDKDVSATYLASAK